ncbi:hypothetical protein PPTG_18894 [Phytophthora nicotianae INRA-310]|uniref:Sfi1 spindle body domain-containing protein n=1 Tax=Phytophthora nicotianae (strain INRA-310) TaxID=761204 RepID=W2PHF3_PHYN3|nr:hypothetical protein PPTG_18894 [Phytophthora nicotianae INRA-310]ETM99658.1 hypothetical protein PPTG_18894 [Phytophthora nicotianae INRA-310]
MAHDQGEACVYVKQSVLRELEQERRRLKWQLSRALQTSDTHAAELEASKAKVKDLLTIVELNKGVADQAVQRSHGQDVKRRAELETLHQQHRQQRQRYVDLAVRSMIRRVRYRQQRDALHSLQQVAQLRTQRREALRRLLERIRWRILRQRLQQWKHLDGNCTVASAKVYPLHLSQPANGVPYVKVDGDSARWQLLRKMWRKWERVIRWERRLRELVALASARLVRLVFEAWRSRVRMLRQRRVLLRRLLVRNNQRLQQLGLTRFRLRCAEVSAHEWTEVLKTAYTVMEEERKLRADVQSSAVGELHTAYVREQQRQQRFTELQTQRLEVLARRECTYRALMILRCNAIQSRQKTAIALRFQRLQHRQRVVRRHLTLWKHKVSRIKRIRMLIATWDAHRTHSSKATCFKVLAWTLHRRRQRRLRLRGLISKLQRVWLMRGWLGLRVCAAVQEYKAIAHVEMWQLSQQMEATQACYREDIRRRRRTALKYQVTCALIMADKKQEQLLRRVLRSWSTHTATNARHRHALKRLLGRKRVKTLHSSLHKWVHLNQHKAERSNQLHQHQRMRRQRLVVHVFDKWRRYTYHSLRSRLARYQQRSCIRVWRHWLYLRQQRAQSFERFHRRTMARCQRRAFQSWKLKSDHYVKVCANISAAEHELVSRLWRRWIGFVASRLHKQRRQQQKALAGLRKSLQQKVLSTVFLSWRTNWRCTQSRDKVIVRTFRWNASLIRVTRYFHAWRQYSELTARRRAALTRICRRHRIRRLETKWNHWIRTSKAATITRLEAATIRAQEQADKIAQATGRANVLRRIIRNWRLVSIEAKRQRRRRALFAEKRRYMALQGSMRLWQKHITCCSLTKQRRMLRHLLNRLHLSLERGAFRLWERHAHAKTLFARDRVSAELFRRSEVRVMVLVEEIRAERERRIIFTAWRSMISRKKDGCECLQSILMKHQHRLLLSSWSVWTHDVRTQRCVARLNAIIIQQLKAAAWCRLMQMYHYHGLKATGARLAGVTWRKILMRHAWNHWKRVDSFLFRHAALAQEKTSSIQSMLTYKETIARRYHQKRVLSKLVSTWKQNTTRSNRLRRQICDVLRTQVQASTVYHFHKWRTIVERQNHLQHFLRRVVKRQKNQAIRSALGRWRRWTLDMAHRQQLEQTKQALTRQKEVSAKRIAVVKFLSWQRPCLEVHFVRWKVHVEQRRRYVVEQRAALSHQHTRRLLRSSWRSWHHLISQSKRRAQILSKILNNTRLTFLVHGFYRWDIYCDWMHDVNCRMIRLARIYELWRWRTGFSALRQHQHAAIRRQSVMAASAFSAHSSRQRERQTQMMRFISLVLQRKTNVTLYDRCFCHWIIYVKMKTVTKASVKLARVRAQKRMVRRCFVEWQLSTRQSFSLRQKLQRRQEIWQSRRLKRVWNAWLYFTQHSLYVKHSIYDRLVICALRHSLQGAWRRWKAYTRHEKMAQWEHATAERDRMIDTLEDKHERLLLRAAQLGQQNHALRQRLVSSAARRIDRVLELVLKSRVATAFDVWKQQVWVLQSRLDALGLLYQRLALQRLHSTISHLRHTDAVERVQLDTTEWAAGVAQACALQWLKRRVFLSWRAVRRARRGVNRHVAMAQRRRELKLVRSCWAGWTAMMDVRTRQYEAATALMARRGLVTALQAYWQWKKVHERSGMAKLHAIRTFVLLRRMWQRRLMINAWSRWRNFTVEEDAAILHTRLVLVELELEKATDHHTRSQLLLRTFSHWKLNTRIQRERRDGHTQTLVVRTRQRVLGRHFRRWRRRTAWTQTRLLLLRRMERHLRRHYRTLTKYSLWVWFARVQTPTHKTTQLHVASKQFTPTTDVTARIARAVLTDLLVAELELQRSKLRSAWRLVNATVRNARRRMLRTAFNRLVNVRSSRHLIHAPNARAFVDRLTIMLLRWGFQHWKQQYLALAIQEAEAAQHELLRALHDVTSYRQTLDPYTFQRVKTSEE